MTVEELVKKLKELPQDKRVYFFGTDRHFYDMYNVIDYSTGTVVIVEDRFCEKELD